MVTVVVKAKCIRQPVSLLFCYFAKSACDQYSIFNNYDWTTSFIEVTHSYSSRPLLICGHVKNLIDRMAHYTEKSNISSVGVTTEKWVSSHKSDQTFGYFSNQWLLLPAMLPLDKGLKCYGYISLYNIGIAARNAPFGQGTGPVLLDNVGCTGTESSLLSCSHRAAYCSYSSYPGVVCPPCK